MTSNTFKWKPGKSNFPCNSHLITNTEHQVLLEKIASTDTVEFVLPLGHSDLFFSFFFNLTNVGLNGLSYAMP